MKKIFDIKTLRDLITQYDKEEISLSRFVEILNEMAGIGRRYAADSRPEIPKSYVVTGTLHGSIVCAMSEGDARRAFHTKYNGESILGIREMDHYPL